MPEIIEIQGPDFVGQSRDAINSNFQSLKSAIDNLQGFGRFNVLTNIPSGAIIAEMIATINANQITGTIQASQIGVINASQITGTITASQIGTINASNITGTINAEQIGSVNASTIIGFIDASQIGSINASSILGTIIASQISSVSASCITGTINASQIGSVNASAISGLVEASQIGSVFASKISGLVSASQISSVSASAISGTLQASQIGAVYASVLSGALNANVVSQIDIGTLNGVIVTSQIAQGLLDSLSMFAQDIRPIQSVSALPSLPSSNYPVGAVVYLTTDQKMYRNIGPTGPHPGGEWSSNVAASDISGQLTAQQIGEVAASTINGIIAAAHIGGVQASNINGQIIAGQLAGGIIASQIASVYGSNITGTINGSLIDSIAGSQIQVGTITASHISSVNANTINSGTIAASLITSVNAAAINIGTINASQIGSLNGAVINVGSVDNDKISSVDAGKVTTGYLDVNRIQAGTIDTARLVVGDPTNLIEDPSFERGPGSGCWAEDGRGLRIWSDPTFVRPGSTYCVIRPSGYTYGGWPLDPDAAVYNRQVFEVRDGDQIYAEYWAKTFGSTDGVVGVYVQYFADRACTQYIDSGWICYTGSAPDWTNVRGTQPITTGVYTDPGTGAQYKARWCRVLVLVSGQTRGLWSLDDVLVRKSIRGAWISELSADKINVGTLNGNIVNITNLNADEIRSGTINGARIGAASIDVTKLSIRQFIVSGLVLTPLTPPDVQVSASTVYYDGNAYPVGGGVWNSKFLWWDPASPYAYGGGDTFPQAPNRFLVATNDKQGHVDEAWNKLAANSIQESNLAFSLFSGFKIAAPSLLSNLTSGAYHLLTTSAEGVLIAVSFSTSEGSDGSGGTTYGTLGANASFGISMDGNAASTFALTDTTGGFTWAAKAYASSYNTSGGNRTITFNFGGIPFKTSIDIVLTLSSAASPGIDTMVLWAQKTS